MHVPTSVAPTNGRAVAPKLHHKVVKPRKVKRAMGRKRRRQREREVKAWSVTTEAIRRYGLH